MKVLLATLALSILPVVASSQSANAQDAPNFFKAVAPPDSLGPAMQEYGAVFGPKALDAKTKELIGLGVAAEISLLVLHLRPHYERQTAGRPMTRSRKRLLRRH